MLAAADAERAIAAGADTVIVSNHGGRQLGSAIATIDAPDVARIPAPVLLDGSIRRGSNVLRSAARGGAPSREPPPVL